VWMVSRTIFFIASMTSTSTLTWSPDWTLGFLGTGKISSAVCTGYCTLDDSRRPRKILVSERSMDKSAALKLAFPEIVEVVASNEEIVSRSDVVFIGLLPTVAIEVIPKMPWENCKLIVSMMAAVSFEKVISVAVVSASVEAVEVIQLPHYYVGNGYDRMLQGQMREGCPLAIQRASRRSHPVSSDMRARTRHFCPNWHSCMLRQGGRDDSDGCCYWSYQSILSVPQLLPAVLAGFRFVAQFANLCSLSLRLAS
jgi:hypothetical protein